ncbi:MAG TPA: TonB-dependent receptor [Longimicrobiales bacterium]|nr:TonB-dependent receptor [Longimicrobiales bacterium]
MWWLLLLLQDPGAPPPRIAQTVVVSAATEPVPLDGLARAVVVITREEISRLPSWSLADLLRLAGSVEVRARGSFGAQSDLSVRGGGFGQVVVLVDGVRLNDSQSGHHNTDIPVAIDHIERIEIVRGTGSSLYGADAVTGAINIITAARPGARVSVAGGEHDLVRGAASATLTRGSATSAIAAWGTRTSGFMFDREVATGGASFAATFSPRRKLAVSHLRNAFGANGFYGPSPSKEWTDQTLVSFADGFGGARRRVSTRTAYRTHGDHFLWDIHRPGFAENRHRSHAITAAATFRSGTDRNWTSLGAEMGLDWIRSNNLGDHAFKRAGALIELQRAIGTRTTVYPGLRYDRYSAFGDNWSPSVSAVVTLSRSVRARASAGRAFRVPTFTERYYRDPAHEARSGLGPERAWGFDGGIDWTAGPWSLSVTPFARLEADVIDWVRTSPQDRWQTANIHEVRTRGIEAGTTRSWRGGFLRAEYAWIDSAAPSLSQLSKYVADYARHSLAASASFGVPGRASLGVRTDCKRKVDGRSYCGVDVRAGRAFGPFELFVEAANLFNVRYQEIVGVDMGPRWLAAGLRAGRWH